MRFGHYTKDNLVAINVLDPKQKVPQPKDLKNYSSLILGGSGQFNITDWKENGVRDRVQQIVPLLKYVVKNDFPTLSICFGHQLLPQLFGGQVARDENQSEDGTYQVHLNSTGKKSPLFKGIPNSFYVVLGHKDSVTKLPKEFKLLASSDRCRVQAFQIKNHVYSVQFHPELDKAGLIWRLKLYPEYLIHKDLDQVKAEIHEVNYAPQILANFKEIVNGQS
jgi:GMP synthase (glutamine-hydrolysing)